MSWNYAPRIRFSPALWAKWLARNDITARRLELRAGIDEFRRVLEERHSPRSCTRKRA